MAIAGASGVGGVQVSLDDGQTWQWAQQTTPARPHVWSLWRYTWDRPTSGRQRLAVRVVDQEGRVQTARSRGRWRSGASGLHRMLVTIG